MSSHDEREEHNERVRPEQEHEELPGERLHGLTVLFSFAKGVKDLFVPIAILLTTQVFRKNISPTMLTLQWGIIALLVVLMLAWSLVHWLWFRYQVTDRQLKVVHGVIIRKRQYIPLERIQTIDLKEGILHRIFGMVQVQVQTAGSKKPEVVLHAVTRAKAQWLRQHLRPGLRSAKQQDEATARAADAVPDEAASDAAGAARDEASVRTVGAEPGEVAYHAVGAKRDEADANEMGKQQETASYKLGFVRLLLVGLSLGSMGLAISIIMALLSQVENFVPGFNFYAWIGARISLSTVPMLIAVVFVLAWLLGVVASMFKFAHFTIRRVGTDLHISRGLVELNHITLPLGRIQAIRVVEDCLWQPFGFAAIHVDSIGYGSEKEVTTILYPLLRKKEVPAFLQTIIPTFANAADAVNATDVVNAERDAVSVTNAVNAERDAVSVTNAVNAGRGAVSVTNAVNAGGAVNVSDAVDETDTVGTTGTVNLTNMDNEHNWNALPKKAILGYMLPNAVFWGIATAVVTYFTNWGLLGLVLVAVCLAWGFWQWYDGGTIQRSGLLVMRFRKLSRTTVLIPKRRMQSCEVKQHPLQRRRGLVSIAIVVASRTSGSQYGLRGLLAAQGNELIRWCREKT